jgi:hypothetical protein
VCKVSEGFRCYRHRTQFFAILRTLIQFLWPREHDSIGFLHEPNQLFRSCFIQSFSAILLSRIGICAGSTPLAYKDFKSQTIRQIISRVPKIPYPNIAASSESKVLGW